MNITQLRRGSGYKMLTLIQFARALLTIKTHDVFFVKIGIAGCIIIAQRFHLDNSVAFLRHAKMILAKAGIATADLFLINRKWVRNSDRRSGLPVAEIEKISPCFYASPIRLNFHVLRFDKFRYANLDVARRFQLNREQTLIGLITANLCLRQKFVEMQIHRRSEE